jgi:hypothetical protein
VVPLLKGPKGESFGRVFQNSANFFEKYFGHPRSCASNASGITVATLFQSWWMLLRDYNGHEFGPAESIGPDRSRIAGDSPARAITFPYAPLRLAQILTVHRPKKNVPYFAG